MAAKRSTKPAVETEVEEVEEVETAEPTIKQLINEGINKVIEATGVDSQKARYKAMRAIAYEAFSQAIADGEFDELVESAIANADELPSGWELEKPVKDEEPAAKPVKKAAAKPATKPAAKSAAKPAAKAKATTGRTRPSR